MADYEDAQKRVLELFQKWHIPETLMFHQFLVRVGEPGGYPVIETDDLSALHEAANVFAVLQCRVEPVLDIMDAIAAE